jgi:hypothetical protein
VYAIDHKRLARLNEVSGDELAIRTIGTAIYLTGTFAILQGLFSFAATVAVGLGWTDVESWRPLFGSLRDASSLRGFRGYFSSY